LHSQEAIAAAAQTGDADILPVYQVNASFVLLMLGERTDAAPLLLAALRTFRLRGHRPAVAWTARRLACAFGTDDAPRVAQLHGAADALVKAVGSWATMTRDERQLQDRCRAELREFLGDAEFDRAYGLGAGLSYEQAADFALGSAGRGGQLASA
jgi:hypothetical protein